MATLLTQQEQKAIQTWLVKQIWTPSGRKHKHNPFTPTQVDIIEMAMRIELEGYIRVRNGKRLALAPLYAVYSSLTFPEWFFVARVSGRARPYDSLPKNRIIVETNTYANA